MVFLDMALKKKLAWHGQCSKRDADCRRPPKTFFNAAGRA
jgi:hypothetical protein